MGHTDVQEMYRCIGHTDILGHVLGEQMYGAIQTYGRCMGPYKHTGVVQMYGGVQMYGDVQMYGAGPYRHMG